MHTVFITGCASGFGHRLARRLLTLGHRVVATDPTTEGWPQHLGAPHPNLLVLPLDVRDAQQVQTAVAAALQWAPVDVLVNNGGFAIFGSLEEADLEAVRDLFDVNVLGAARVTQALLPTLRSVGGTVVNLSSVAGRTVFPESGYYAATKYAVEAMSEALFQETCTFGVRVRLVEPGSFATRFLDTAAEKSPEPDPASPYAAVRPLWDQRKQSVLEPPQDPERVVDAIVGSLDDPLPFLRLPVGDDAVRILAARDRVGPDGWSRLAADRNGLDDAARGPHAPPTPQQVLDGTADLALVRHLLALGHLDHWADTTVGRDALDRLAEGETPHQ